MRVDWQLDQEGRLRRTSELLKEISDQIWLQPGWQATAMRLDDLVERVAQLEEAISLAGKPNKSK